MGKKSEIAEQQLRHHGHMVMISETVGSWFVLWLHDENGAARIPETVITDTSEESPAKRKADGYHRIHKHFLLPKTQK